MAHIRDIPIHPAPHVAHPDTHHGIVGIKLVTHGTAPPLSSARLSPHIPPQEALPPIKVVVVPSVPVCSIKPDCHAGHATATKLHQLEYKALVDAIIAEPTHAALFVPAHPAPPHVGTAAPDTNTRLVAVVLFGSSEIYESSPFNPLFHAAPPAHHLPT